MLAVAIAATWWAVLIATALLVAVIAADIALGASPAKVRARRGGDTSVRLGEEAQTQLILTNTGTRTINSTVRNSWTPSAGARGGVQRVDHPRPAAAPAAA